MKLPGVFQEVRTPNKAKMTVELGDIRIQNVALEVYKRVVEVGKARLS